MYTRSMATKRALLSIFAILLALSLLQGVEAIGITLDSPADGTTILKSSIIDLNIDGGGTVNVTYTIDAAVTNTTLASPWNITANWTKGLNTLTVYAVNGSESSQNTFQFTVNNSAPIVNDVYPAANVVLATTVNLTAAVQDLDDITDVDNVKIYYSLANTSVWTLINTVTTHTTGLFTTAWNISAVNDSTYKIKAVANDSETTGEVESLANITVNNVNQAPVVDLTSLTGGQTVSDDTAITWTATDPDGETSLQVDIYYSTDNSTWTNIVSDDANDGTYSWNTDNVANGNSYRINVTVTDAFGGLGSDISGSTFTVNNQAGGGSSSDDDSSSGEVSVGTGASAGAFDVSQIFQSLTAGSSNELNINVAGLALTKLIFIVASAETDARIKVRDLEALPSSISVEPANLYQLFEVEATNTDSLTSATFEFKIPKSWLTSSNLAKENIVVKRYVTSWANIPTSYVGEEGDNYKYTATTPGFSVFAIAAKNAAGTADEVVAATDETTQETTPISGFATGSLPNLSLPDISFLPGGWITLIAIISTIALASFFVAGRRGLFGNLTWPEFNLSTAKNHVEKAKIKLNHAKHAPVKKRQLPKINLPQFEFPHINFGQNKQKKLKFGKDGWQKYKSKN